MNTQGSIGIDTTLIIAILSLITSLATFFVSYVNPAKIKCSFGPTFTLYYDMEKPLTSGAEGGTRKKTTRKQGHPLYIYIPTTFINSGSKAGSIYRIAITLHKKDNPDQTFQMDWRAFCSYHRETGIWAEDELAHEVSVVGNSTLAKWVSFYWGAIPGIEISPGSYIVKIYYWNIKNYLPKQEMHELHISKENLVDINKNLKGNRDMVELSLDDKNRPNNLTNQRDIGRLINEKSKGFIRQTNRFALASMGLGIITYIIVGIVDKTIAQPYHALWWSNPRIITVLITSLPFVLGCALVAGISLKRLWDSRKIISNATKEKSSLIFQFVAPIISLLSVIASVLYIISFF